MTADATLQAERVEHDHVSALKFITCGSVDDGKSTLIGRLLFESHLVFEDHLDALERDSRTHGTQDGDLDFALLVDGLAAEREQGITIDVAYRFFSTEERSFIVADTPGHEQYTRNMVTGASTADLAVLLVDARKGVLPQTRRHSYLASLVGIRSVIVAINKLDLVGWSREVYDGIVADYDAIARELGIGEFVCIPISALKGDNIVQRSENTPWYDGPTLMRHLETVEVLDTAAHGPLRLPVQWVNRPDLDFRGFAGMVAGGEVHPGDEVVALPSGVRSRIQRVVTGDGDLEKAIAGQSITVTLADEVDISRGDLLCAAGAPALVSAHWRAHVVWMHIDPLVPGAPLLLKCGTRTVTARLSAPEHVVDVQDFLPIPASTLGLNDIGVVTLRLDRPIAADPYLADRETGGFILIDRLTNATVAAGMLREPIDGPDVRWETSEVDRAARRALNGHGSSVVWFTGLSGAGKSTIADLVERRLHGLGVRTYLLDGDNLRHGLNAGLGFSPEDRGENVRRVGEVARLMVEAGLVTLVSLVSPIRADRDAARALLPDDFVEVFVDTPLGIAEERDVKGLYARARAGEIPDFTGVSAPYEAPASPELVITGVSAEEAADQVVQLLRSRGVV
jgi:bifunctional enzyme CysN/CysC